MEIVPLVLLGALVYKLIDFIKYVRAGDWNAVATQATVWIAGIVVVLLFAASTMGAAIMLPGLGVTLGSLAIVDKVIIGLFASSLFSAGKDVLKAVDNTQTAATPPLTTLSQGEDSTTNGN
jgi:hypothetical protein